MQKALRSVQRSLFLRSPCSVSSQHFRTGRFRFCMIFRRMFFVVAAFVLSGSACAQAAPAPATPPDDQGLVVLDWTPPALAALSSQAAVRNAFTFDRNMLQAAASLMPNDDEPTRQAINHLDGISIHLLRFGPNGIPDENAVNAIRDSYHLRGWKHIVTTMQAGGRSATEPQTSGL